MGQLFTGRLEDERLGVGAIPSPENDDAVAAVIQRRASGKEIVGKRAAWYCHPSPRADCLPCWFDATELYFLGDTSLQ